MHRVSSAPTQYISLLLILLQLTPFAGVVHAAESSKESDAPTESESPADMPTELPDDERENQNFIRLAPGFLISIRAPEDRKLNGDYRIKQGGKLELPYNVIIETTGLKLKEVRAQVLKAYQPYFRGTPNVQLSIKQRRYWVEIRGLVEKPGQYLISKNAPLDEVIATAGGLADNMTVGYARIEQGTKTYWVDLSTYFKLGEQNDVPRWLGGEKIVFQMEKMDGNALNNTIVDETIRGVHLIGEIKTPGELTIRKNADVYYYILKSGGPTTGANLDKVELLRPHPNTGHRTRFAMGNPEDLGIPREGDVILIHTERQSRFERTLGTVGMVAGILTTALTAGVLYSTLKK